MGTVPTIYSRKGGPSNFLRYGKEALHRIDWDEAARAMLMENISEVQRLMVEGGAARNHERPGKCRNCSRRHRCPESLA